MNPTDAPIEDRLRATLHAVAATTVVPQPDPDAARLATGPTVLPLPREAHALRASWRLVAAAALVALVLAGVLAFGRSRSTVVLPAGTTTSAVAPSPTGTAPRDREELDANGVPIRPSAQLEDHWHAAYGIYVCGAWIQPLQDGQEDRLGIHTHGEGVIHIHPFSPEVSGRNATLGAFARQVGIQITPDGIDLPDGWHSDGDCASTYSTTYHVVVEQWRVDDASAAPVEHTSDFDAIGFTDDRLAFTIAIVPIGTTPPKPPSIPELDKLTDVAPPNGTASQGETCIGTTCVPTQPTVLPAAGTSSTDPSTTKP